MSTVLQAKRLEIEMNLYDLHKLEWLKTYPEEFVVIRSQDVLGFFKTFHEAYVAGARKYGTDIDFLVKRVTREEVFLIF